MTHAVRRHYDDRAPTYDDNPMHRGIAAEIAGLAADASPGGVVLDVGTGTALVLRALPTGGRRVGIDLSPGMLARARAADPTLLLARADATRLPLPDGSVDVVTCVTVLHLLPDPAAALAEWRRVLRPGGVAFTATFVAAGTPGPRQDFPRDHDSFRTPELLGARAEAAGLRLTASHRSDHGLDMLLVCRLER